MAKGKEWTTKEIKILRTKLWNPPHSRSPTNIIAMQRLLPNRTNKAINFKRWILKHGRPKRTTTRPS